MIILIYTDLIIIVILNKITMLQSTLNNLSTNRGLV